MESAEALKGEANTAFSKDGAAKAIPLYKEAALHLALVLRLRSESSELSRGASEEGEKELEELMSARKSMETAVHSNLAICFFQEKSFEEAIVSATVALKNDP